MKGDLLYIRGNDWSRDEARVVMATNPLPVTMVFHGEDVHSVVSTTMSQERLPHRLRP